MYNNKVKRLVYSRLVLLSLLTLLSIIYYTRTMYTVTYTMQRWARAYRDQTFHECINTNNGTEALNKALKYTYLPRAKRATNLSGIVITLIDTFLPALRQKYLFTNFEQSSANRKYKDSIPSYLHDRPKAVILHCLDRKASSSHFESEDISLTTSNGIFEVKSGDNVYTINFGNPSCTCPDWIQTNYPCKHFFAVFRHHPTWNWNALPSTYLKSPRLSLDSQALDDYFNASCSSPNSPMTTDLHLSEESSSENTDFTKDYSANITKRKVRV